MTDLRLLKAELEGLVLACADMRAADVMCRLMLEPYRPAVPAGATWEEVSDGLWTGAIVSYFRPFGSSRRRIDPEWERFHDDAHLDRLHREVKGLRDQFFAHSDDLPYRQVVLMPPDDAREERSRFERVGQVHTLRRLCNAQLERMEQRVTEIAREISEDAALDVGDEIPLDAVPDEGLW